MDLKDFGAYIKKLRVLSGFKSQRQLALEAGVSPATLSRVEAGVQHINPITLKKMSRHLKNVTYQELMTAAGYIEYDTPGPIALKVKENQESIYSGEYQFITEQEMALLTEFKKYPAFYRDIKINPKVNIRRLSKIWEAFKNST
ncbi:helix-turn-helix domain-containing protein [Desulfuribacillus stibiiarsenatis]|uniref:helix-turn-helix domain-containing protein n=1 Tax=Desulfuribacillus stibiiarsenatis TaxID=1390249 RepID=UPI00159F2E97|nr:helix-turn-helix domain-containing protein [Desulfuribacillus stibiiarsenatis]